MANFDQNAEFEPLRVEISILSQRIRDFQRKISQITCLTQSFLEIVRNVIQGVIFLDQRIAKAECISKKGCKMLHPTGQILAPMPVLVLKMERSARTNEKVNIIAVDRSNLRYRRI